MNWTVTGSGHHDTSGRKRTPGCSDRIACNRYEDHPTAGRGHLKHTEGGDFRQATYRAVRQGLKKAESILLEPMYDFTIEVPAINSGRLLADLHRMEPAPACRRHHRTDRHQRWRGQDLWLFCRTIQYNYLPIRAEEEKSP